MLACVTFGLAMLGFTTLQFVAELLFTSAFAFIALIFVFAIGLTVFMIGIAFPSPSIDGLLGIVI